MEINQDQNQGSAHSLIDKARRDPQAFVYLFDLYVEEVYRFCLGFLFDKSAAQLATLDVFKRAAREFRTFDGSLRQFHLGLFRYAVKVLESADLEQRKVQANAQSAIDSYKQAFCSLELASQQAGALVFLAGLDASQIARLLNRNLPLVREQVSEVQKVLAESIDQFDPSDPLEEFLPGLIDKLCAEKKMDEEFRKKLRQELAMIAQVEQDAGGGHKSMATGLLIAAAVLLVAAVGGLYLLSSGLLPGRGEPAEPADTGGQAATADTAAGTNEQTLTEEQLMYEYDNILQLVAKQNEEGLIRAYQSDSEITRYLVVGFLGGIGGRKSLEFLDRVIEEQEITNPQDPHIMAYEKINDRLSQTTVVVSDQVQNTPDRLPPPDEGSRTAQGDETDNAQEALVPDGEQPIVSGRVLDAQGQPVVDLEVYIENTARQVTTTNEQGVYGFASLAAGLYSLGVVSQEYVLSDVPEGVMSIRIAEGVPMNRDIKVSPAGWISVAVVDSANRPVDLARVYLSARAPQDQVRQIAEKTLEIEAVEFGPVAVVDDEYYVTVTHEDFAPSMTAVMLTESSATEYLVLQLTQVPRIEGIAQDAFGNPIEGIEVIAVPDWWVLEDLGQGFVTDPKGGFALENIPPGPTDIYIRSFNGGGVLPDPVFLERINLPVPEQPFFLVVPDSILEGRDL